MKRILALLVFAVGIFPLEPASASQSARCDKIKARFFSKTKPYMTGVVTRSPIISYGFKSHLGRLQRGKDPTTSEINRAYRLLIKDCGKRSDKQVCIKVAGKLKIGAVKTYNDHRDWVRANCKGRVNIR